MQIFTTHNTVLYIDSMTGELRHGSPAISPSNARMVFDGANAEIFHMMAGNRAPITYSAERSHSSFGASGGSTAPSAFEVIQLDGGQVALKARGLFLSAERDGRVTLSRKDRKAWESFALREARLPQTPRIAAFTMAYNERIFLPIWLRYYGEALGGEENLFVLDLGSDDGSTSNLGLANRVRIPREEEFNEDRRCTFINRFQASLLCYYDVVIFSDPDEILIPDPEKFSGLREFVKERCDQFVTAVGVEVQHLVDAESDIDLNLPILSQRRYVRFAADYCKTLISRVPLVWMPGFHSCNYPPSIDRDLFMFHLKTVDRKLALEHLRRRQSYKWSERHIKAGFGYQDRLGETQFISKFFPFSSETIKSLPSGGFDFSSDLARMATDRPNATTWFKGSLAVIPEKFHKLIPGADFGSATLVAGPSELALDG
jgi:hypothetical protein